MELAQKNIRIFAKRFMASRTAGRVAYSLVMGSQTDIKTYRCWTYARHDHHARLRLAFNQLHSRAAVRIALLWLPHHTGAATGPATALQAATTRTTAHGARLLDCYTAAEHFMAPHTRFTPHIPHTMDTTDAFIPEHATYHRQHFTFLFTVDTRHALSTCMQEEPT